MSFMGGGGGASLDPEIGGSSNKVQVGEGSSKM